MFKIIHTSDWHLGQNFYGYDRSEEQSDFLRQLADIVRKHTPDALLVSGDIFHVAAPVQRCSQPLCGRHARHPQGMPSHVYHRHCR